MPPTSCPSWPTLTLLDKVKADVAKMAETEVRHVRVAVSPYRICPLGAHIDHQEGDRNPHPSFNVCCDQDVFHMGGSVTAMAISQGVLLGFVPSGNDKMWLRSGQFAGEVQFSLQSVPSRKFKDGAPDNHTEIYTLEEGAWGNYARGAVLALQQKGHKLSQGIVGILEGPKGFEGCGVSSSAAVGVAFLLALEQANGLVVSQDENIELDRLIENGYLGLKNGVLDQSAILLSQRHCLTSIRCAVFPISSRKHELVYPPWYGRTEGKHYKILLAFSGLQHALSSKPGYNLRVTECQEAARILLKAVGRESSEALLCNVTMEEYSTYKDLLQGDIAKRARHFFTESSRVFAGIEAWSAGNLVEFGRLMSESGLSSIHDYECGCEPLVQLREILVHAPGVYGARFSGAGFRGCCVAFVAPEFAKEAAEHVRVTYLRVQPVLARSLNSGTAVVICDSVDKAQVH